MSTSALFSPMPNSSVTYSYVESIRQALDKTAIIAITDPTGVIIEVNDKFCELSKYSREELLGQKHNILNSGHHPARFFEVMWKTILSGKQWEGEILNRAKDGALYWVHTYIIPFLNSSGEIEKFVSIRYDITSRKNAERNLNSLLDSNFDGLLIYDLSGMTRWHNRTAETLFPVLKDSPQHSVEALFGPGLEVFKSGEFRVTQGEASEAKSFELQVKNYTYLSRAAYLVSFRDVTEKIKQEAILIQQDRLASIGVLASGLAHEIGTPLGVVRGRAEMIATMPTTNDSVKTGAEIIMQQIDRVSQLVRGLLKLARGEESVALQEVHLVSLLAEIQDFIRYDFTKQNVQLDISVDEHLEVKAVPTSLFQVFLNLFVNATHAIGQRRQVEPNLAGVINVSAENQGDFVVVKVEDNGCGMDDATLRKLFTPFFTTKDVGSGTGLGLAMSYKIVQSWGGFIQVSTDLGHGTTFQIHLPKVS